MRHEYEANLFKSIFGSVIWLAYCYFAVVTRKVGAMPQFVTRGFCSADSTLSYAKGTILYILTLRRVTESKGIYGLRMYTIARDTG